MTTSARVWSSEQLEIFNWFEHSTAPSGLFTDQATNLIVRARAGTGKTTTIIEGVNRAPEARILLCAFNKKIADELTKRISNPNATAKTLHSIGFAAVQRFWKVNLANGTDRADGLAKAVCGNRAPDAIVRLVSKLHTKGREIAPHSRVLGDLTNIQITFECEPEETWAAEGFDSAFVETKALEAMELASNRPVDNKIDFSDMIFLPLRNAWLRPVYDLVIVDEAQDMTAAQLEMVQKVCKGRIAVVGDDRQAIYGFRGADSGSIDRLKKELNAAELGLKTTYRCATSVVNVARSYVPDFVAATDNPVGVVDSATYTKLVQQAENGSFILSRSNAPLVSVAMTLLKSGKRARIAGRDIGATLIKIVNKLATGAAKSSVPVFIERVATWKDKETARLLPLLKKESAKNSAMTKMELIEDQAEMIISLSEGVISVSDIIGRMEELFTDNGLGSAGFITCSSVHKSKGLEADRVFILADTLRKGDIEEENIAYVAVTRAINHLTWVWKEKV